MTKEQTPDQPKPGPDPERLKIDGDWEEAMKKAVGKDRPDGGWPEKDTEPDDDEEKAAQD